MDTIFSLLGLYQLSALVVPGAVATGGVYYAIEGVPPDPTTAGTLALLLVFFVVGASVQGAAVVWERRYWNLLGGLPSNRLVDPADGRAYEEPFRDLVTRKLDALIGGSSASLQSSERFALARAELRRQNQDARAESLNATYGLSRGIVTASAAIVVVALACVIEGRSPHRDLILAAAVVGIAAPIFNRFHRFGWWFAREVWQDFAALSP